MGLRVSLGQYFIIFQVTNARRDLWPTLTCFIVIFFDTRILLAKAIPDIFYCTQTQGRYNIGIY